MKRIAQVILLLMTTTLLQKATAQNKIQSKENNLTAHHKNIFLEIKGAGIISSLNMEMRINPGQKSGLGLRAGIGARDLNVFTPDGNKVKTNVINLPVGINYLIGKKNSFLDAGLGIIASICNTTGNLRSGYHVVDGMNITASYLNIGYKHLPSHSGISYGVSWNPLLSSIGIDKFHFGLSVGYCLY